MYSEVNHEDEEPVIKININFNKFLGYNRN